MSVLAPDPKKWIEAGIVGAPFAELVGLRSDSIEVDHVRLRLPYRLSSPRKE